MNRSYKFSIIKPPKSRFWVKISGVINGMCIFIGLGVIYGALRVAGGGGDSWIYVRRGFEYRYLDSQFGIMIPGILVGIAIVLIPQFVKLYRNRFPVTERFEDIGVLTIRRNELAIQLGDEQTIKKYEEIGRIDVYHYKGVTPRFGDHVGTFDEILSIRMVLYFMDGGTQTLHVQNNTFGRNNTGALYHILNDLKRENVGMWRKIQFWEKF